MLCIAVALQFPRPLKLSETATAAEKGDAHGKENFKLEDNSEQQTPTEGRVAGERDWGKADKKVIRRKKAGV